MVPRTSRKQVALITFALPLIFGLAFYARAPVSNNAPYKATDHALDLAVVNGITEADKQMPKVIRAKASVIPHHLVAATSIALGIRAIASSTPRYVIVISPDHYGRCQKFLCTTHGSFDTFFGNLPVADDDVDILLRSSLVGNSDLFKEEHGIYSIAPFIKHYVPEAKIIPLVITQHTRGDEDLRKEVLELLRPLVARDDVALVISSDFSHYLTLPETKAEDIKTQSSFCAGRSDELLKLENPSQSDCPLCLFILRETAGELGFWNPTLLAHTNSAELLHDDAARELTSHYAFALSKTPASPGSCPVPTPPRATSTFLFVGDMMFDRYIRQKKDALGEDHIFSCVDPLLKQASFVVGNLEGPITDNPSTSQGTAIGSTANYRFTFPQSTAPILRRHNISIVNIGNNHITDFGISGFLSTKSYLKASGINYFGGIHGDSAIYRMSADGMDFSFINYNEFGGESADTVKNLISEEHKNGRKVIVYTHWGIEYTVPTDEMRSLARSFAESGADLIIGSHPHVVQSHEMIGKTPVYYSLGNFIFDQYFQADVMKGLALLVRFDKDGPHIEERAVTLGKDGRTCPTP